MKKHFLSISILRHSPFVVCRSQFTIRHSPFLCLIFSLFLCLCLLQGTAVASTPIYRSVGPSKTTAVTTRTGTLNITGSTATFSLPVCDSVGVGDAIQYDSDDNGIVNAICFIHARTSSTVFTVKDASGAAPTATTVDDDIWDVYRAYTSLANAETGTENTEINAGLVNFDSWSGGKDITLATGSNEIWNIACYGDALDGSETCIDGWTTAADNYIRIYTPVEETEVGTSQRHDGTWNTEKYRIYGSGARSVIDVCDDHVRIDGLQIYSTYGGALNRRGIFAKYLSVNADVRISNNLIKGNNTSADTMEVYGILAGNDCATGSIVRIWNNVIYNWGTGNGVQAVYIVGAVTAYIYNNTVSGCRIGINKRSTPDVTVKNNVVVGCPSYLDYGYDCVFNVNSTNNAGYDDGGGAPPPTDSVQLTSDLATDYFESASDFHIDTTAAYASEIMGAGVDLSSDPAIPFNTDIDGDIRRYWDIGADEAMQPIPVANLLTPNGGDSLVAGTSTDITWTAHDDVGVEACTLYYSTDNGANWTKIADVLGNPGTYAWTVTGTESDQCLVKVVACDADNNTGRDSSDNVFTIIVNDTTPPTVDVMSPASGDSWAGGSTHNITWTANDNEGLASCSLYYSSDNGATWSPLTMTDGGTASWSWSLPVDVASTGCQVRVIVFDQASNHAQDESDVFSITDTIGPTVSITSPNGSEAWPAGASKEIKWDADDGVGVVSRAIHFKAEGGDWSLLDSADGNTGSWSWDIGDTPSAACWIRVTVYDGSGNSASAQSADAFSIVDKPYFTSAEIDSVKINGSIDYTVTYEASGGDPKITYVSTPPWIVPLGNTLIGTAPSDAGIDTVVAELLVEGFPPDTLVLVIYIYDPTGISLMSGDILPSVFDVKANVLSKGIEFVLSIDKESDISLEVYSVSGRKHWSYKRKIRKPGFYQITWNFGEGSGIYTVILKRDDKQVVRRFMVAR